MQLAYVTLSGRGQIDALIAKTVEMFEREGVRLAGTVQDKPVDPSGHPCDMDLRILPDGPAFRISQPLGLGANGCRLDGGVIESIATAVEARLCDADILIINKFGKQEVHGRGLCPAILAALEAGVPTLVGVNEMNAPDFHTFAGGISKTLPPELHAIRAWYEKAQAPLALTAV